MLVAALALGAGSSGAAGPREPSWVLHGKYSPSIDPANFLTRVDNRDFPLEPGGFHNRGVRNRAGQTDDMV